jgi:hypothetical protein
VAGQVLAGGPALQHPGGAGEEPDLVGRRHQLLGCGQAARLAGVAHLGVDHLVGAGLDRVGDPQQGPLAFRRRAVPPGLEGGGRGPRRRVHVGRPGDRGLGEDLAGAGVDEVAVSAVDRLYGLAVDEVANEIRRHKPSWRRISLRTRPPATELAGAPGGGA